MPEIKQKGYDLDVRNVIIHQINKEASKNVKSVKIADRTLDISNKEIFFLADVKKSFSGPGKTYGVFEEQSASTIFENLLEGYINGVLNFLELTHELMKHYERILDNTKAASGGFLVFADYFNKTANREYFLVLAINNKQSYFFNDDLTLSEIESIDLSKIDIASLIDLSKWQDYKGGNEDVDTYLSFRSGLKNLSQYFQTFVGCADKANKKVGSRKLVTAIKDYLASKNIDKEKADDLMDKISSYCIQNDKNNKGVFLSDISRILDEDNPEDFEHYASDEKYSVNPIISIDRNVMKLLTKTIFKSKNQDFSIEFDNILIGDTINYDEATNSMTIDNVPEELASQLKKHM